jgi:hypothetical protein
VCDGELTARQALVAIAALLGTDTQQMADQVRPIIRTCVAEGILE